MYRLQKGANQEKQDKCGTHKEMLSSIDWEGSEDAGLKRATQARGNFGLLERGRFGRVEVLRSNGAEDDEYGVGVGGGER